MASLRLALVITAATGQPRFWADGESPFSEGWQGDGEEPMAVVSGLRAEPPKGVGGLQWKRGAQ